MDFVLEAFIKFFVSAMVVVVLPLLLLVLYRDRVRRKKTRERAEKQLKMGKSKKYYYSRNKFNLWFVIGFVVLLIWLFDKLETNSMSASAFFALVISLPSSILYFRQNKKMAGSIEISKTGIIVSQNNNKTVYPWEAIKSLHVKATSTKENPHQLSIVLKDKISKEETEPSNNIGVVSTIFKHKDLRLATYNQQSNAILIHLTFFKIDLTELVEYLKEYSQQNPSITLTTSGIY